jgi:restriction system protein
MTMLEASIKVLTQAGKPLTAQEIYELIIKDNLFTFGAKKPISVLQSQLRQSCIEFNGKTASKNPKLKQDSDKRFSLI